MEEKFIKSNRYSENESKKTFGNKSVNQFYKTQELNIMDFRMERAGSR